MFSAQRIADIVKGRWLVSPASGAASPAGVSIDTRTLQPGDVFFAIAGENFDGHDFVGKAFEAGASLAVVVNGPDVSPAGPTLQVKDTAAALQQLAAVWRDHLQSHDVRVIAVTGSNGKTTTRHLIHTALCARFAGTQSPKSFNNHLGVPLTLLAARASDDFVVAEVGTNHPGEIPHLSAIVRPDVAVITNVGTAHIGHFGTREAIGREKAALVQYLQPAGCAVVPCDEQWPDVVIPMPSDTTLVKVGEDHSANFRVENIEADPAGVCFTVNGSRPINLPLVGRHNAVNAAMALAVARWCAVKDDDIAHALSRATAVPMRLDVRRLDAADGPPLVLLNDSYNANPNSMLAGLQTLQSYSPSRQGRRVAILGDMRELGDDGPAEHEHLGNAIVQLGDSDAPIHRAVCVGELMQHCAAALQRVWRRDRVLHVVDIDETSGRRIAEALRGGDVVLLKGSRGMALERLIPFIEQRLQV